MKIKLKKKENSYAQVHKKMLYDRTLSLKAKGLGAILESYSNDFDVNMKSIELGNTDGIKSIRSATKELEDGYYLFRFQVRGKGGLFTTYWVFDSEKLNVNYLKTIIVGLKKIELITKNTLLERDIPYGNTVTDMPSRTTYNNINNKSEVYKRKKTVPSKIDEFEDKVVVTYPRNFTTSRPVSLKKRS